MPRKLRVLVVEDYQDTRESLRHSLSCGGTISTPLLMATRVCDSLANRWALNGPAVGAHPRDQACQSLQ